LAFWGLWSLSVFQVPQEGMISDALWSCKIGTAHLRLDLLANSDQPPLRSLFHSYVDSRLETYRKLPDIRAAEKELARTGDIQGEIWTQAIADVRNPESQTDSAKLLLPALNEMIDITTTRTMAARSHRLQFCFILCLAWDLWHRFLRDMAWGVAIDVAGFTYSVSRLSQQL
jgi:hypothetical protein